MADDDTSSSTYYDPTTFQVPDKFRSAVWANEGGPGTGMNKFGYTGSYQTGTSALQAAGLYTPAKGEDLDKNEWKGTINIPGFKPMTVQEFNGNQKAQDAAFNAQMYGLAKYAQNNDLYKYLGKTVGGVPITEESLAGMLYGRGPKATSEFLASGGTANPQDGNGQRVSDVGGKIYNYVTGSPAVRVANTQSTGQSTTPQPININIPQSQTPGTLSNTSDQLYRLQALNSLLSPNANQTTAQQNQYRTPSTGFGSTGWGQSFQPQPYNPLQSMIDAQKLKLLSNANQNDLLRAASQSTDTTS